MVPGVDALQEIFATLARNRLRTALTALSVAWGMLMLVVLLGAGRGLENGAAYEFRDDAVNSLWLYTGKTTLPYAGRGPGREVKLTNDDYDAIQRSVPGVEHITGRFYLWGEFMVNYGVKHSSFDIRGTHPGHQYLEKTIITEGRFLDDADLSERRKVCVIGAAVSRFFFAKQRSPLGEYLTIRGRPYQVIGVFEDVGGEAELNKIYIPITTAQLVYNTPGRIHQIMFTIGNASLEQSKRIAENLAHFIAERKGVSPLDRPALHVQNNLEQFERINSVFVWIKVFVWIVGIGTLLAGIVGVSNIMLISVKERTREIGVRKALGATPFSIVSLIVGEAVIVTSMAGYAGLVAGIFVVEFAARHLKDVPYLRQPDVDLSLALAATAILVAAGALAGFFPARQAASVNPIEALRA
ncbi:MAG TPA: ABC transporter permease [Polyangiaceae bacterium]|jgi:putative ABC transport system permease protein|nr:ABC transporter permease [Polyangiaceae bacterium]